jgi:hypothetical protein
MKGFKPIKCLTCKKWSRLGKDGHNPYYCWYCGRNFTNR